MCIQSNETQFINWRSWRLISYQEQEIFEAGDKVKITLYRGREMARQDMGVDTLNRVVDILDDFAEIDKQVNMEGRRLLNSKS